MDGALDGADVGWPEISISPVMDLVGHDTTSGIPGGEWTPMPTAPLSGRLWTGGAWTGQEFITWGGVVASPFEGTDTGARFNPSSNTWKEMEVAGAPSDRHSVSHIWTGSELIVFGGGVGYDAVGGGAAYAPVLDSWRALNPLNMPSARLYHAALWTGSKMLIWGGLGSSDHLADGALYDPVNDEWTTMSAQGAPARRCFQSAIWTGQEALIWGGCEGSMSECPNLFGDGARYDPANDEWTSISNSGAPSPRATHFAAWTGEEMVIFGGCTTHASAGPVNDAFAYHPGRDQWRKLSSTNAPAPRCDGASAFISGRVIIWGGYVGSGGGASGGAYDPRNDSWVVLETEDAPPPVQRFAWSASNDRLFVWGGIGPSGRSNQGAVWRP